MRQGIVIAAALAAAVLGSTAQAAEPEVRFKIRTTDLDKIVDTGRLRVAVVPLVQTVDPLRISVGIREGTSSVPLPITRHRRYSGSERRVLRLRMTENGLDRIEPENEVRVVIVARRGGKIIQTRSQLLER